MQILLAKDPDAEEKMIPASKIISEYTGLQTTMAGLEDLLEEPLRGKFLEIKAKVNATLASLQDTDKAPAAIEANGMLKQLLWMLSSVQSMMVTIGDSARGYKTELATTKAGLTAEVEKAIEARIKSGELVAKADVEKKISDATATATTAAREAITAEMKRINDRRLELTKASLPIPGDEVLNKDDEAYKAGKETAAKRIEELKPFGLSNERVLTLAWNTDESAYQDSLNLMKEVAAKVSKPGAANPFINRQSSADTKTEKTLIQRAGVL